MRLTDKISMCLQGWLWNDRDIVVPNVFLKFYEVDVEVLKMKLYGIFNGVFGVSDSEWDIKQREVFINEILPHLNSGQTNSPEQRESEAVKFAEWVTLQGYHKLATIVGKNLWLDDSIGTNKTITTEQLYQEFLNNNLTKE